MKKNLQKWPTPSILTILVFLPTTFSIDCETAPTSTLKHICEQLSKWDEGARNNPPPEKTALPPGIDENLAGLEIPVHAQTAFDCMTVGCLCGYLGSTAENNEQSHYCRLQDGTHVRKSLRKEYRMLSDDERMRLHRAIKNVKQRQGPGSFDFFANVHRAFDKAGAAHSGPGFLPWHREYIKRFEIALRLTDPTVSLPYWDSSLDSRIPDAKDSILWSEKFFGDSDKNGYVISGDFSPWQTIQGTDKIRRNVGAEGHPFNDTEVKMLLNMNDIQDVLAFTAPTRNCPIRPNFYSLEYTHGNVHIFVGGDMYEQATSGNDPSFYFHHAFTDMIWELWRQQRQDRNSREIEYPLTQSSCSSSYHVSGADMYPFGPWKNIDGLSNKYTDDFYEYEPRPTCFTNRKDCGSDYLFCMTNLDQPVCATKIKVGGSCKGLREEDKPCYQGMCVADECIPDPDYLKPDLLPTSDSAPRMPKSAQQSETCYNTRECCDTWTAEGQCEQNKNYMREHCPASCGICTPVSYTLNDTCSNRHIKCGPWSASGECSKNPKYMNENCRKACNLCNIPKTCSMSTKSTTNVSATVPKEDSTTVLTSTLVPDNTETIVLSTLPSGPSVTTTVPEVVPESTATTTLSATLPQSTPIATVQKKPLDLPTETETERDILPSLPTEKPAILNPLLPESPPSTTVSTAPSWVSKCTSPGCNNENMCCQYWANQGECRKNPIYMMCWCRVSCGVCTPNDYSYGDCADYNPQCVDWSNNGECDKNPWMLENCRKSCGTCVNFKQLKEFCEANGGRQRINFTTGRNDNNNHHHGIQNIAPRSSWGGGYSGGTSGYGRPRVFDDGWGRWGRSADKHKVM
ncbi:unnamed protein product [Bursaphelenchus okinawaensis]|uniref:ShKT domain-containing protein n=1 Tax=Bursaphelenchus okinawaensis TaxID=465554 RepID=A0A811L1W7_9BILA|nr:unnamed protein product [Bursaphelenchus okinawaensis]CAG9115338.1 unnamed protein product [Bursaphelenchus okinawaensis]